MANKDLQSENQVLLDPSGSLLLPEKVMEEIVIETLGCKLWYNEKTASLGIRLLRGENSPPVKIKRLPGQGGRVKGMIEAGPFLTQVGFSPLPERKFLAFRYFKKYHLIEIQLGGQDVYPGLKENGFLNDYEGLGE